MNHDDVTSALFELASTQRWFSGRAGTPEGVELGDWVVRPGPGPGLRPAVLLVSYPDGRVDRFLIPLRINPDGSFVDACDEALILLDALRAGAPGFEAYRQIPDGLGARRFSGEQSNTTVFFGTALLAKVFRRLESGRNVDVELHRALAGTGTVAELYGTWSVGDTDLAVFLECLQDPTDGFELARRHAAARSDFSDHAREAGRALARLHEALAERLGTATLSGEELAAAFRERFADVVEQQPAVGPFADAAAAVFDAVPTGDLPAQRIHGDCHLGQVLLTQGRWVYVDFEGEPLRPMADRRLPDSPLRDVAGMLRSLRYASVMEEAPDGWLTAARDAFLTGYGLDPARPDPVLAAYETDKAGYEVSYESRFRPHLVRVPIDFLAALPQRSS
ncbi:phosphotransferase [Tessaracoccus lacteus]|uniref:Phosphotransferase n=1 Tax=Tessaracoccus lacteus TaxID=3041766 RepID=A0ABY8PUD0_9ACTN|nr:phosphotransferase [Tessaracoccus sp. T21]WGT46054.1 phosphotransferase [Tessaracoccus sp. T21]